MAPDTGCKRIVQTIPGNMTGGDDDTFICADGSAWQRTSYLNRSGTPTTGSGPTAWLRNGHVCDHK